jgi:hypothetical protein
MTQPNRDQELEDIVDRLDQNVADEREEQGVPGKPSDRERASSGGPDEEPPD